MKKYYWTTKDGTKIDVDSMTEDHLRNVLKLILKRDEIKRDISDHQACDATIWDTY